jgi:hypothetical protein
MDGVNGSLPSELREWFSGGMVRLGRTRVFSVESGVERGK